MTLKCNNETLVILSEECAEVIQAASKIQRFGINDKSRDNLEQELGDMLAMIFILDYNGEIDTDKVYKNISKKLRKLKKYSSIHNLDEILRTLKL
jgi:NTP pyrophosphatase (non-canonical NTP hydrolase)